MIRQRYTYLLTAIVGVGFALRAWLVLGPFSQTGFAWDLSTFADWMTVIDQSGSDAYSVDPSINYPPVFAQLLQLLNVVGGTLPCCSNPAMGDGAWKLLKWLPVLADVGVALLLAYAGRRWYSRATALWAAGLYLFIPVTWYDSAIWGQMDSVAALPMLASLILLAARKPEWSAALFIAGLLTKPQAILIVIVIAPFLLGLVLRRELPWWRIGTTIIAGLAAFALLVNRWSLTVYVDGGLKDIPVLGNLVGAANQYLSTANLFPYMSVNAYNPWALAGVPSMASQFQNRQVSWTTDNYQILGVSAHWVGLALFALVCAAVVVVLLRRTDPHTLFMAAAVVLVAFFVVMTRVHERYLVHAFAVLALVWATTIRRRIAVVALGVANWANLHAILVGGIQISTNIIGEPPAEAKYPHNGAPPEMYGLGWPGLPSLGTLNSVVVILVIATVTAALAMLLVELLGSRHQTESESSL